MIKDELLSLLFREFTGSSPDSLTVLPKSGSDRIYCRMIKDDFSVLGVWNPSRKENDAFTAFASHFCDLGLRVPRVYKYLPEEMVYLTEDLGDTDLYSWVQKCKIEEECDALEAMYKNILKELVRFQFDADRVIDYELCYPRKIFDRNSVMWDLNYFKYMFLKLSGTGFNEQNLEEDFATLAKRIEEVRPLGFLYRDFQSRNVMIKAGIPWFIDFQGGRKGAPYYDAASLLLDPYVELEASIHDRLLDYYFSVLPFGTEAEKEAMHNDYWFFGIVRLLQALGAYGFRGLYERKPNFAESIPPAVRQLDGIFGRSKAGEALPEIAKISAALFERYGKADTADFKKTTLIIESFSFIKGIPESFTAEGGYLFDCRLLSDPHDIADLRDLSGRDQKVVDFFENKNDVQSMIDNASRIILASLESPGIDRAATIRVAFGCAAGKHRSVYCAERLASLLKGQKRADVILFHNEIR
jgi:aminoglycoside/choline kinase family phosphotransferase